MKLLSALRKGNASKTRRENPFDARLKTLAQTSEKLVKPSNECRLFRNQPARQAG